MADVQIKNIGSTQTTINDSDKFVEQDGVSSVTKKVTASTIRDYVNPPWRASLGAPNTVTCNGNGSYSLVYNSTDLTPTVSNGMRLKLTRTATAPTQCTSLNGTTQYYNKTTPNKLTFTDDFTLMGWMKIPSYGACVVASRYNGTSGFALVLNGNGQVQIVGFNAGAANFSQSLSYQSIPLNRWVHVAACLDMSTFTAAGSPVYINGISVPVAVSRSGTNPTSLIQAGNLEIGSQNSGTAFFPGKLAQVAIFDAILSAATIRSYMSQGLAGTETNLKSAYSFNNSVLDLNTTTPNDLTAQGSAVATSADSPFTLDDAGVPSGTTDYGVVMDVSFATNTTIVVQVPEGCAIPTTGGVSATGYSPDGTPYGFPNQKRRWQLETQILTNSPVTIGSTNTWFVSNFALTVPIGEWKIGYKGVFQFSSSVSGTRDGHLLLAPPTPTNNVRNQTLTSQLYNGASADVLDTPYKDDFYTAAAQTTLYMYGEITTSSGSETYKARGDVGAVIIFAENGYI